jgi:rSAM/selenodomain-associated transferase 2
MRISVVIPVLNERCNLPATIESGRASVCDPEIIAVDGGSVDGSLEWLQNQPAVRVTQAECGKGPQQNAGAKLASGDVILFLHADCLLPVDARAQIERVLQDPRIAGGCFLASWNPDGPALRFIAFGMNLRTRIRKTAYGDQALFVRRSVFHQVGGFPDWPLFEDTELVRRIKEFGRFSVLGSRVTMSARRFQQSGIFCGIFLVYLLQLGFLLGVSPARLKKWFVDIRPHMGKPDRAKESQLY